MFTIRITNKSGDFDQTATCRSASCQIGKSKEALVRTKGWSVAPRHLRLEQNLAGVYVEDTSRGFGIRINGKTEERYGPLSTSDVVSFGPYTLSITELAPAKTADDPEDAQIDIGEETEPTITLSLSPEDLEPGAATSGSSEKDVSEPTSAPEDPQRYMEWAQLCHKELLRQLDFGRVEMDGLSDLQLRELMDGLVTRAMGALDGGIPEDISRDLLKKIVLDESIGLGAIEDLLADPDVTEVMVNNYDDIYIEKAGKLSRTQVRFSSPEAVLATIERIISPLGRRIDESSPMVDARLKDGSRVNAIIPPLALRGPCITIRKFAQKRLTAADLVSFGALNEPMVEFLEAAVVHRMNIVVSGGTGSGKTTLLNVLSNFIPLEERVVTVEDAAELKLVQPHVVTLEARPANLEGRGAITIRDLVRNCLRMRPDRIVVGECRGGEALDMLQAMNTGHDGSLTTGHANSPRDMLSRLEVMVLMAGMDLPSQAIREQISSAVDIIIQQSRFADGSRRVTSINEVTGIERSTVQMSEIFRFSQEGYDANGRVMGKYVATGVVPQLWEEFADRGINMNRDIFKP